MALHLKNSQKVNTVASLNIITSSNLELVQPRWIQLSPSFLLSLPLITHHYTRARAHAVRQNYLTPLTHMGELFPFSV